MTSHDQYRDDLPLYAAGGLSKSESQRMERHLVECAECREELKGLDEAVAQIATAVEPVAPPAHLKQQLLARIEAEPSVQAARIPATPAQAPARAPVQIPMPIKDRRRTREPREGRGGWFWTPAFAAAILIAALAGLWRHDRAMVRSNRELTSQLRDNTLLVQRAQRVIDALNAADAQHITLAAAGAKPQPEAKAVYSSRQRSLVLLAGNLNSLPDNKTYELWLLPADGTAPVPAGTFKPDDRGSATLVLSQFGGMAAKGFAVTIENAPGSSMPTMPIILSGTT